MIEVLKKCYAEPAKVIRIEPAFDNPDMVRPVWRIADSGQNQQIATHGLRLRMMITSGSHGNRRYSHTKISRSRLRNRTGFRRLWLNADSR